jgi:hypothetical protein
MFLSTSNIDGDEDDNEVKRNATSKSEPEPLDERRRLRDTIDRLVEQIRRRRRCC